jgi:bifunctional DNase/RNase
VQGELRGGEDSPQSVNLVTGVVGELVDEVAAIEGDSPVESQRIVQHVLDTPGDGDCQPGIALALRFNAKIYVNEEVLLHEESKQHTELLNLDSLSNFIDNLSPDDFENQ